VQRINLGCNRESTLSASHNVVLIPANDESALPVCFRARDRKRDLALVVVGLSRLRGFPFERSLILSALLHWTCSRLASRHESRATSAIEFRTGEPISRGSVIARVIALVDRQPIGSIGDTKIRFRGTSYRNRSHLEIFFWLLRARTNLCCAIDHPASKRDGTCLAVVPVPRHVLLKSHG